MSLAAACLLLTGCVAIAPGTPDRRPAPPARPPQSRGGPTPGAHREGPAPPVRVPAARRWTVEAGTGGADPGAAPPGGPDGRAEEQGRPRTGSDRPAARTAGGAAEPRQAAGGRAPRQGGPNGGDLRQVCGMGTRYGGWAPDSPATRICHQVYGSGPGG